LGSIYGVGNRGMSEEFNSNRLNDLLRDVAEECIDYATKEIKSRGLVPDPIIVSLHAYTLCMNWTQSMFKQIMGECQDLQKRHNEALNE